MTKTLVSCHLAYLVLNGMITVSCMCLEKHSTRQMPFQDRLSNLFKADVLSRSPVNPLQGRCPVKIVCQPFSRQMSCQDRLSTLFKADVLARSSVNPLQGRCPFKIACNRQNPLQGRCPVKIACHRQNLYFKLTNGRRYVLHYISSWPIVEYMFSYYISS